MEPKTEKIGKLDNIVYSGDPQSDVTFVFHGFGADAGDLVPLKPYLGLEKSTWVFPNGRLEVPIAPGFFGRAWWPIDMAEVEKAMQAGGFRDLMSQRPPELDHAVSAVMPVIEHYTENFKKSFRLIGFSQGAMLSTELALTLPQRPLSLSILSGAFLDRENWISKMKETKPVPFFQSHGEHDPILSFVAAETLFNELKSNEWSGTWESFSGGHEIPPPVLSRLKVFLDQNS